MKSNNISIPQVLLRGTLPILLGLTLIFITGCKASVEGETKSWEGNVAMVDRLANEYPGFATPLQEVKTTAEAAWAEAEGISDEEKKIEAMEAANDLIDDSFAQKLGYLNLWIDEVTEIRSFLFEKEVPVDWHDKMERADGEANEAVEAAKAVRNASANDIASAESLIDPVYTQLKKSLDWWKSQKKDYTKWKNDSKKKKKKK